MMSEENYLLKWNDFEKNLSEGLKALKVANTFCDVTLACEDSQLEAHRVVLSVCSNFFQNILTKNAHSHPLLYLKGVRMADMESIIHFVYHGEANVALEDLESFLAAANELQIKGLTAPSVNSFRKNKHLESENTGTPAKKIKREKTDSECKALVATSRSVLKRRNTDNSTQEEMKEELDNSLQMVDADDIGEICEENELAQDEENSPEALNHDQDVSNFQLDDANGSGSQTDDVAAEVKRLTDQYLQKVEVSGGVIWCCTRCGKQGKMKHHVREHIESNHIDCLTFNCPFCNKEIKNRVALRSHISKNHREENLRSKGLVL